MYHGTKYRGIVPILTQVPSSNPSKMVEKRPRFGIPLLLQYRWMPSYWPLLLFSLCQAFDAPKDTHRSLQSSSFSASCVGEAEVRTSHGDSYTCTTGTSCLCPRFSSVDFSWNCLADEIPCRNIPQATPRYPTNTFQATIVASVFDGSSVTNVTQVRLNPGKRNMQHFIIEVFLTYLFS